MLHWLSYHYSPEYLQHLIAVGGLLLVALIIFAETGLFFGVALPGDSLLLITGVCARIDPRPVLAGHAAGTVPLLDLGPATILAALMAAALAGNLANAAIGRLAGDRIRSWPDSRWFKRRHLQEASDFFACWGGWALVGGRFVPVVRTFVPLAAGITRMGWLPLTAWSAIGSALWIGSMVPIGYALASSPVLVKQLHWLVLAVVAISFLPVAIALWSRRRRAQALAASGEPANS